MDLTIKDNENQAVKTEESTEDASAESPAKIVDENAEENKEKSEDTTSFASRTESNTDPEELAADKEEHATMGQDDDNREIKQETVVENNEQEDEKNLVETPDEAVVKKEDRESEAEKKLTGESAGEVKTEEESDDKAKDEWLDILGSGLLKKKVIKAGKEGTSRPAPGQEVCIKSEGALDDGTKVDIFEKITFILGDGDVITAWDLSVATMLEGEVCELVTAPRFAYGSMGREDGDVDVPPDSEITYTLELLSIKPGPDIGKLTDEQRIEFGDTKRERGNDLFRREEYSQAVYSYSRALKYLESSTSQEAMKLKIKCWNNLGASHLKLQDYQAAKEACECVLKVEPENVKALFRKGKVFMVQGDCEEALELLRKANSLDPENRLVRKELFLAKQKFDKDKEKERSMYQRMVNGLGDKPKPEDKNTFFTWPVILGITGVALGGIVAALLLSRH